MVVPRLIQRLDDAIVCARSPMEAECLRAERAGALARLGLLTEARMALAPVRAESARQGWPTLQAWVEFVSGLIEHFDAFAPQAQTRFAAAKTLAITHGDAAMRARAAAWLANCEFNARRPEAMADELIEALTHATTQDRATLARVSLVRASAARMAGLRAQAQDHFRDVRTHALADGDTAMIAALLHNRASANTDDVALHDALGESRAEDARRILIETESTGNFDQGLGNSALGAMNPVMRAQLCVALQRWDEAVALLDTYLRRARAEGMDHRWGLFVVLRAWCHWQTGRPEDALADMQEAEGLLGGLSELDDLAAAHARLGRLWAEMDQPHRAERHLHASQHALEEFRQMQRQFAAALRRVDALFP